MWEATGGLHRAAAPRAAAHSHRWQTSSRLVRQARRLHYGRWGGGSGRQAGRQDGMEHHNPSLKPPPARAVPAARQWAARDGQPATLVLPAAAGRSCGPEGNVLSAGGVQRERGVQLPSIGAAPAAAAAGRTPRRRCTAMKGQSVCVWVGWVGWVGVCVGGGRLTEKRAGRCGYPALVTSLAHAVQSAVGAHVAAASTPATPASHHPPASNGSGTQCSRCPTACETPTSGHSCGRGGGVEGWKDGRHVKREGQGREGGRGGGRQAGCCTSRLRWQHRWPAAWPQAPHGKMKGPPNYPLPT